MRLHLSKTARRFILVGVPITLLMLAAQQVVLRITGSPVRATWYRLIIGLPLLYLAYSRYVLGSLLQNERMRHGILLAELRMMGRTVASIGVSMVCKVLVEPALTTLVVSEWGLTASGLVVLFGDFGYGPVVNYLVLISLSTHRNSSSGH